MLLREREWALGSLMAGASLLAFLLPHEPPSQRGDYVIERPAHYGCTQTACGDYVETSCHPESDGPVQYTDSRDNSIVMNCGGYCTRGLPGSKRCTACPPPEWTACTERPR